MAHCNTVLSQLLKWVPRHEFETLAKRHHSGRSFRSASRWAQFVGLFMAQVTGRDSLRDIIDNLDAQAHRLYHLGAAKLSRTNLARINKDKPYTLYEELFKNCCNVARGSRPATSFVSRTCCIHSMPASSSCVWRPSRGPISERLRGRSSCMSG